MGQLCAIGCQALFIGLAVGRETGFSVLPHRTQSDLRLRTGRAQCLPKAWADPYGFDPQELGGNECGILHKKTFTALIAGKPPANGHLWVHGAKPRFGAVQRGYIRRRGRAKGQNKVCQLSPAELEFGLAHAFF